MVCLLVLDLIVGNAETSTLSAAFFGELQNGHLENHRYSVYFTLSDDLENTSMNPAYVTRSQLYQHEY